MDWNRDANQAECVNLSITRSQNSDGFGSLSIHVCSRGRKFTSNLIKAISIDANFRITLCFQVKESPHRPARCIKNLLTISTHQFQHKQSTLNMCIRGLFLFLMFCLYCSFCCTDTKLTQTNGIQMPPEKSSIEFRE